VFTSITATWSSAQPSVRLIVTSKTGSRGCAASAAADIASGKVVMHRVRGASGSTSNQWKLDFPGTVTLCGFLLRSSDGALLAATAPVALTYRPGRASVSLEVPARVTPSQIFRFFVPVYAELRRDLVVTIKDASARGCGASYMLDAPVSENIFVRDMQGSHRYAEPERAPSVNGIYQLCAYVIESGSDPAPEATASATFEVGPDLCAAARAKLTAANRLARRAQSSVNRLRRTYRRYERRARRAEGATRRAYRRLARRDKRRYEAAVRRRDGARQVVTTVQSEVTAACGGK
jgi:hypothetical protein